MTFSTDTLTALYKQSPKTEDTEAAITESMFVHEDDDGKYSHNDPIKSS